MVLSSELTAVSFWGHFSQGRWVEKGSYPKVHKMSWQLHTLNSLGTISFGVSTPTRASIPQKIRMDKIMAKSLMSFLAWNRSWYRNSQHYEAPLYPCLRFCVILQVCIWWQYKLIISFYVETKVHIVMSYSIFPKCALVLHCVVWRPNN